MNDYGYVDAGGPVDPVRVHLVRSDLALVDPHERGPRRRGASIRTYTLTAANPVQQILPLNGRRCSAWIQPTVNDVLISTSESGAQQGGGGAGLIPGTGSGTTVAAYGTITINNGTAPGTAAASIPAGSLPAGRYRVDGYAYLAAATTPAAADLLQISVGGTGKGRLLSFAAVNNSAAFQPKAPFTIWATVDGTQAIAITAAAAETGTNVQTFNTVITATPEHAQAGPFPLPTTDPIWASAAVLPTTLTVVSVTEET